MQGSAYNQNEVLETLRPYLELGFSRSKACKLIGLNETTLSKWATSSEEVSMKLNGWENAINKVAMANIEQAIKKEGESEDPRKETSKWWLERKMRGDFATRQEQTGADGAPIALEVTKKEEIEKALDDL